MTARILPPDEWPRLAGTEAESVWPMLDPDRAFIVVVEDGDQIVATWTAMMITHVECLWIAPEHRKRGSVGRRLLAAMRGVLWTRGIANVVTAAADDSVRELLAHVGAVKIPADHYAMRMH